MDTRTIIKSFYDALSQKTNAWQKDLAENVVFTDASDKLHAEGKDAFIRSYILFLRAILQITLKELIVEKENACAVVGYTYISPRGEKMRQNDAEVWKIIDGKIRSLTIYFDITEFRQFMKG